MSTVVVVGDALLDRDLVGSTDRLCPDAPVPVVDEEMIVDRAGGAALAACLAADLGADVTLVCALASDAGARRLAQLLADRGVRVHDCTTDGTTVEKMRIRVGAQSLLRIDRGAGGTVGMLPDRARSLIGSCDALLVADYGHGMTQDADIRVALAEAIAAGVHVVWDPHPRGAKPVAASALVTPNLADAAHLGGPGDGALKSHVERARRLRAEWHVGAVAVTLGRSGALLVTGDGAPLLVPVDEPAESTDACGAGDAFASAATVALADGCIVSEAVEIAVQRAALFVRHGGAGGSRGSGPSESGSGASLPVRYTSRSPGSGLARPTVVATGGCFDLLHAGHVHTLERASRLGDRLVVLLNSDRSVRRLKGAGRPVQNEHDRAAVLRSLGCVDEVITFDESTPAEALRRLRPDVFVKGGDYAATELPEAAVMADWNGSAVTVPFLAGRSTTALLDHYRGGTHVG